MRITRKFNLDVLGGKYENIDIEADTSDLCGNVEPSSVKTSNLSGFCEAKKEWVYLLTHEQCGEFKPIPNWSPEEEIEEKC